MGTSRHSGPGRPQKSLHHHLRRGCLAWLCGWGRSSIGHRDAGASAWTIAKEPPGGKETKRSYGKCLLVEPGGLATCADKRSSAGGRIIWPVGDGAKAAWVLPHAQGDLPAALDLAANLRSNDCLSGWPKTGFGRNSKSRTYWIRQFGVCRRMRVPPAAK